METPVPFSLTFSSVRHGWIRGALTAGTDRREVLASWLVDTPKLLVQAVVRAWDGTASEVLWVTEPDSVLWTLEPDQDRVRITLQGCDDLGPYPGWTPTPESTYLVRRVHLGGAVLTAMDQLAIDCLDAAYGAASAWGHAFPRHDVAELRERVGPIGVRRTQTP